MSWPNLPSSGTFAPYHSSNWKSDRTSLSKRIITAQSLPRGSLGSQSHSHRQSSVTSPVSSQDDSNTKLQPLGPPMNTPRQPPRTPISACGDLEEPFLRPTRNQRNTPSSNRGDGIVSQRNVSRQSGYAPPEYRPRSRASNTSRKRSGGQKNRPPGDPGRKQSIMNQVALYWNECIRIADEEKVQANLEIEKLQEQVTDQRSELQATTDKLQEESSAHQKTLIKLQELQKNSEKSAKEKQKIVEEANYLNEQLCRSKARSAALKDKSRVFRKKLNEAILEQQNLFNIAKESYDLSFSSLKADLEAQTAESASLHVMLEGSRKKTDQLRNSIGAIRSEILAKEAASDRRASELESILQQKECEMQQKEKQLSKLHDQIFGEDSSVQKAMAEKTLQGVRELARSIANATQDLMQNREITSEISTRLNSIIDDMQQAKPPSDNDRHILQTLEKLKAAVYNQLIPETANIAGQHSGIKEIVDQIRDSVKDSVPHIRDTIERIANDHGGMISQQLKNGGEVVAILNALKTEISATQEISHAMKQNIADWTRREGGSRSHVLAEGSARLNKCLEDQNAKFEDFERLFQNSIGTYTSKIDELAKSIDLDKGSCVKAIQEIASQLRQVLQEERSQASDGHSSLIFELQGSIQNLQEQLKDYVGQLNAVHHGNVESIVPSVTDEEKKGRDTIYKLEEQNKLLQSHALDSTKLGKRWCSDIGVVGDLRSKLQSIQASFPRLDGLHDQVAAIIHLNGIVHATSTYLNEEAEWLESQYDEVTGQSATATSDSRVSPPRRNSRVMRDSDSIHTSQTISIAVHDGSQTEASQSFLSSTMRRVTLKSPVGNYSPSPPPSIEQEQLRRRETGRTKPILKDYSTSSQETVTEEHRGVETELGRVQQRHRLINTSRSTSEQSKDIIKEISSGFLPEDQESDFFKLPLVGDFEQRDSSEAQGGSNMTSKRKSPATDTGSCKMDKRVRIARTTTSQAQSGDDHEGWRDIKGNSHHGTQRIAAKKSQNRQLGTYSCQVQSSGEVA